MSFRLNLPPDWLTLDSGTSADRIPVQVQRLVETAAPISPDVSAHRGFVERQVREALRQARSQQLDFCAVLATVVDDVLPMLATITVALRPMAAGGGAAAMLTELQRLPNAAVSVLAVDGLGDVVRAQFRQTVSDRDLPLAVASSAAAGVTAIVFQYFIPTADGRSVAVLTAASPLLELEDAFAALFDAIAGSFRFESVAASVGGLS